ncbi:hypothetical protein PGT21_027319 [Puccinia graminis f. sp. tritici]|uniref:Uncharacterized protein n=1 Tax=Puccinia graminis f. sp. tritici TaxID=56615 RepID=A0A5B0NV31_PUCGR|nr:hypothetical protein PGT21_027319 [Puccinia graminis f. sp. tritici]
MHSSTAESCLADVESVQLEGRGGFPRPLRVYTLDGRENPLGRGDARPELFREITGIERTTFDNLVSELKEAELLGDGRLVTVEEQVIMFLDITQ